MRTRRSGVSFRTWGAALLALCSFVFAQAQSGTGSIAGQVRDDMTGRSLQGAVVSVPGTNLKDYTDAQGRFSIFEVPAGTHQVEVSYLGLLPHQEQLSVEAGGVKNLEVYLESRVVELDSFSVRGFMSGQSRAINQQKTAAGIVNVVSEENFGSVLDGNIGQALQRLPGISVDESQDGSQGSINIRGIAGEFNSVQVDGNRVPSSGGSNSFNPRQLAADGVTNIEVIKAPTPDQDGDAIGGIINLVARSAFERSGKEMKLKLSGVLNEEPGNWGHAATFSYSDLLSVGGGEKNLGIAFTLSSYETDRYSRNADQDWVQVDPETNPELGLDAYSEPVWFMESTHFEHDTRQTNTETLSGSIDFRTDERNSFYVRPMISQYSLGGVKYETDIDIDTEFDNDADGNKTYAALSPSYGRGSEDSEASRGWIGTLEDVDNDLYSVSMGGRHEQDNGLLTYDFYFSRNKATINEDSELNMLMEPDDPWFIFEYDVVDARGDVAVDVVNGVDSTDLSQIVEGELEDVWGMKEEKVQSARIDWEREFSSDRGSFTFKTGAKVRKSSQVRDITVNLYEMDEDFDYASVLEETDEVIFLKPKYFNAQPEVALALLESNPERFEFVEDDSLEDSNVEDYDADETVSAAYVMGTYETGIHTIIAGVRFEESKWENANKIVSYFGDVPTVTSVRSENSHSFWLPGIHFRHELSENLILRESYNKSYARPRLSELSRGRWVDDDGNIEDGNPSLTPAVSDNFDAQLEYYTDRGGLYSVGFFYKDIENFTFTQTYDFNELDENGIPIPAEDGDLEYERPVNGAGATNYGVELIARQQLHFLPGALRGFGVALSTTFTESDAEYPNRTDGRELPLEGFSELLYTATLDYNLGNLSARIDYRFRDDYIEGLGDDIESDEFYAAEERIDAEVSYRFNDKLRVFATATNLTDRGQISYQGYPQFVEDASFAGRKMTFGAEIDF
ncbi:TonB-dependent receptor [Pelagicoccus sp. SDUM812005]|uniref:TonB-dependent receptor n=1 Tax=Pelagicoccus sp. SDUM812005 TaxID=3041257 RepID=UPI00280CF6A0|nr:TonB-dependent receptor [Pelagicoccus sp. SDUM812005]MDQ8180847.1 TonB-dependent receptor [Pelagicoccus sp. SDUM812005]